MLRKNARDLEIGDNTMSYGKILTIVKNGNEVVYTCDSSAEVHTYGDVYSPCYEPGEAPFPGRGIVPNSTAKLANALRRYGELHRQ